MNYATIKKCDIANGEGVRVSLFVSGCTHYCKNCFNSCAWDFSYGEKFTEETEKEIFHELDLSYVNGLSLLGGDPFEVENQYGLLPFLKKVKERYPQKNVWCYTGNVLKDDLKSFTNDKYNTPVTEELLSYIDILVDGEFEQERADITLKFKGSANQRVIDMNASRKKGEVVIYI